jgi:hypothetical protein
MYVACTFRGKLVSSRCFGDSYDKHIHDVDLVGNKFRFSELTCIGESIKHHAVVHICTFLVVLEIKNKELRIERA